MVKCTTTTNTSTVYITHCSIAPRSTICRQGACNALTYMSIRTQTHTTNTLRKKHKYNDVQLQNMSGQGQIKWVRGRGRTNAAVIVRITRHIVKNKYVLYAFAVQNQTFLPLYTLPHYYFLLLSFIHLAIIPSYLLMERIEDIHY